MQCHSWVMQSFVCSPPSGPFSLCDHMSTSLDEEMPSGLVDHAPGCVCTGHGGVTLSIVHEPSFFPLWPWSPALLPSCHVLNCESQELCPAMRKLINTLSSLMAFYTLFLILFLVSNVPFFLAFCKGWVGQEYFHRVKAIGELTSAQKTDKKPPSHFVLLYLPCREPT